MWRIDSPSVVLSPLYVQAFDDTLKHQFEIRGKQGEFVAGGFSTKYLCPAPLWGGGFRLGGETIWYLNLTTLDYVEYVPHRERGL
jgi:hypothetical protein